VIKSNVNIEQPIGEFESLKSISIVLPVHNECKNLEKLIPDWDNKLSKIDNLIYEYVIVEDGSTDGTKELIKDFEKKYSIVNLSSHLKRGYGQAVLDGINASNYEFILCTDSDNQITVHSLIDNINLLPKKNYFLFGARSPRKDPLHRIIYSKIFKAFHKLIFKSNLEDPSCPFVIGDKKLFNKMPQKLLLKMREGFWWGFVGVAIKLNIEIREVKIKHFKRTEGEAGYSLFKMPGIIIRNIVGLLIIKFTKL